MIQLRNLSFRYPPREVKGEGALVLDNISLDIGEGERVAVMGATGVGKTTLALILAGLVPTTTGGKLEGSVRVAGLDVPTTGAARLSEEVGSVFQEADHQLFNMTVADEVAFGLEGMGLPVYEIERRIAWVLKRVGMSRLRERPPWQLSDGQQKRLALASVLAMRPRVLVMDEPMAGVDPLGRRAIAALLDELKAENETTILVMEQDSEWVARWAERVIVLHAGRIVLDGPTAAILSQVEALAEYALQPPQIAEVAAALHLTQQPLTSEQAAPLLQTLVHGPWSVVEGRKTGTGPLQLRSGTGPLQRPAGGTGPLQRPGGGTGPLRRGGTGTLDGPPAESWHQGAESGWRGADEVARSLDYVPPPPGNYAVRAEGLYFSYADGPTALNNLSLAIPEGQFVAIAGPNGGGKTTFAKHLNGLLRPDSGTLELFGQPTAGRRVGELARQVGYVFQNPDFQIFAVTVRDELAYGPRNLGLSEPEIKERVEAALARFDLREWADAPPAVLGYGLRRLVTLAAVWAMQPPLWVLDEPTNGLDAQFTRRLMTEMQALHAAGHTLLLITHNMRLVASLAERLVVIAGGNVALDGPTRQLLTRAAPLYPFDLRPPPVTRLAQRVIGMPHDLMLVPELVAFIQSYQPPAPDGDDWHTDNDRIFP